MSGQSFTPTDPDDEPVAAATVSVKKSFPGGVQALDGLDFVTRFGEVTAVLGANGSGKSTLLRILCGALRADAGRVETLDVDPAGRPASLRGQAGYVPQHQALDPEMTGRETLALFCTLYGVTGAKQRERVEALTEGFRLRDVISRRVSTYSGGLRQRLHLAIGILHEPRLLLLDEPTSGLDPEGRSFIWRTMRSYAERGRAVVVVTHDLDEVTRHCRRVALLSRGRTRVDGTPQEIVAEHGRVTCEITLASHPEKWESLQTRLIAEAGVEHVQLRHRQLLLRLQDGQDSDAPVLTILRDAGAEVAEFRRERPNLSSAYFHLTGQDLVTDVATTSEGRRGERRS